MLRLLTILIFLIASVWFGIVVVQHPGYLLIVYQPWMVQMPLWFALLSFLLVLGLFYIIVDSIDRLQFWWFRVKNWLRFRREHRSYSKTQHGLSMLIEGRWKKAEQLLLAGVNQSVEPLMNYLGAAKAAQALQAYDRRDKYLQKAYETAPSAKMAIGLTQAELEMEQGQYEHAAATLTHLRQISPRHPRVLQLLEKVYVRLGDWVHLEKILPALRKAKVITSEQAEQFEKNIYCEMLRGAVNKNLAELKQLWQNVPRRFKHNPEVVNAYVQQWLRCHPSLTENAETKEIEELIRKALKQGWEPELARIYGTLPFNNLNRQLVIVGAWQKLYGPKQELFLTLARLCVRVQLWGKAKDYFEKCLACGPNPEASLEYGKLLEKLGEPEEAMQKYRESLA